MKGARRRLCFGLRIQCLAADFKIPVEERRQFSLRRAATELFIFTPPGAAIRFADGARKSFSIATCLAQSNRYRR